MSGDLSIVKYKNAPPARRSEMRQEETLSLGSLSEIKTILERQFPEIEWEMEPSLLSILQKSGSDLWKDWDEEMLASASRPRLVGHVDTDDLLVRFHSLPTDDEAEVPYLLVELHSVGNPYIALGSLCEQNGWVAVGPNPEDEFIDFEQAIKSWEDWQQNEDQSLEEARERRLQRQNENAAYNEQCQELLAKIVRENTVCPKCERLHTEWRCVIPDDPDRRAYFVCRPCGGSVPFEQLS